MESAAVRWRKKQRANSGERSSSTALLDGGDGRRRLRQRALRLDEVESGGEEEEVTSLHPYL